jgi:hypothetical protein
MAFSNSLCFNKSGKSNIASMKDANEYLKPNISALIKWCIPLNLLQL